MAKQDQQSADIRITPANLGPVQISLNIEDGKASAVFASPHAEVRQAIEEPLPRLREMLNGAGISLDQANVGSQMPQQQSENAARFAATPRSTGENAILPKDEGSSIQAVVTPLNRGRGLVDLVCLTDIYQERDRQWPRMPSQKKGQKPPRRKARNS